MQRAPQLACEQVCEKGGENDQWLPSFNDADETNGLLPSPTILLSSISKCFFHMAAASSDILKEDERRLKEREQNVVT